jgi:NADPH-dependent curcumin reductase CurA
VTGNRQILIDSLPEGKLEAINYKLINNPIPAVGDEEILCKTLMVTIAAGSRAGLQGSASYAGAPKTNIVMNGTGVSRVEESNSDVFTVGDLVVCPSGWQDYSVQKASHCQKITEDIDLGHYLGALGTNGLTAYFGLLTVGQPLENDTVLVSAAAGSVGHLVGQIAKIKGARTVGVTSTAEKCRVLETKLGYESSVSYRSEDFRAELKAACPKGVDVFFDNTGGEILGATLFRMNEGGRVACCGVVSQYDTNNPAGGPRGVPGLLINKRIKMQGFLVFDYMDQYEIARKQLKSWIQSGELRPVNDVVQGLENAPDAFIDLLAGGNVGTRMVRVSD